MEVPTVFATKTQIEDLKESVLWQDIINELNNWKYATEQEMISIPENAAGDNLSTASTLMHIGGLSGIIKAADYLLTIPDLLLDKLEMQKEEQDESRKED